MAKVLPPDSLGTVKNGDELSASPTGGAETTGPQRRIDK